MISSEDFRKALRHFPAGVTIVTMKGGNKTHGLTVSAFASVSAEPPLIMVIIENRHHAYSILQEEDAVFAVNILGEEHEETCRRFGAKAGDRFEGVGWKPGKTGSPILADAIAYVDCVIEAEHEAGDHMIVVGRVVDVGQPAEGGPLLFWRGGYARLGQ